MSENVKVFEGRTKILVEEFNFKWSVENFSLCHLKAEEFLTGSKFKTDKDSLTTWRMLLYPKNIVDKKEKIGISLQRISDDSKANYTVAKISIIRSNNTKYRTNTFQFNYDKPNINFGFSSFIDRDEVLVTEQLSLLPNDTLTILCEVKTSRPGDVTTSEVMENSKVTDSSASAVIKSHDSLIADLQDLYKNKTLADFTLKVDDEEFKVHKNILCARSSVFNSMLNSDMKENSTNSVEIVDFDPSVIKTMLRYIYCGQVEDLTPEMSVQLYSVADKYNLQDLKDICVKYLVKNLDIDNICDVLVLGDLHNEPELVAATRKWFCMNAGAIQKTEKWLHLSKTMSDLVIAMYQLLVTSQNEK